MKTAMLPPRNHRFRIALAIAVVLTVGAATADDEAFSEPWLEQREHEMTEKLTTAIETEGSVSVNRNVGSQLDDADPGDSALTPAPPAAPAEALPVAGPDATATQSLLSCQTNPDHTISCIVHHTGGSRAN
jgi:hypothetical protein